MDSAQRRRVRDLFEAALDREPADLDAWIAREAADDPIVRDEVLSLLTHHSRAGAFLSQPIAERAPELLADDQPLPPGSRVGAYTIVRELGRGGMGYVYLASDERLGRTVALKALAPHLVRDPSQRERLRREARAAASLTHPGICTVYALEELNGELYIASEFVDGRTLGEEIRTGRAPSSGEVLRTARELADALASAHAKNIVHRDLKPDNVMRTSRAWYDGDAAGTAHRHASVHVPRADQRTVRRCACRRVRLWRAAVRVCLRRPPFRWIDDAGDRGTCARERRPPNYRTMSRHPQWPGRRHLEVSPEGAG